VKRDQAARHCATLYFGGSDQNYPDLWRYSEWKREFDLYVVIERLQAGFKIPDLRLGADRLRTDSEELVAVLQMAGPKLAWTGRRLRKAPASYAATRREKTCAGSSGQSRLVP
jgi:hypothetical protein